MWKKKILSLAVSLSMAVGVAPALSAISVNAAEPAPVAQLSLETEDVILPGDILYQENFESDTIKSDIAGQKNGWKIKGANFAIDTGNGFNTGSNAVRFANTQWGGGNNTLTLDLKAAAASKGLDSAAFDDLVSKENLFCFQFGVDANLEQNNLVDGSRNYLKVQNANGETVMAFEAYMTDKASGDVALNLIALNEAKTENVRYELARGIEKVYKLIHNVQMRINPTERTYQLTMDNKLLNIGPHGANIPASTKAEPGPAAQASSIQLCKIEIDNVGSNWYGGIILDNLTIGKLMHYSNPAEAPENPMSMWYSTPAQEWAQSLPLGNGRVGAMMWGNVKSDTVSLNDVTAWSGQDHTDLNLDSDNRETPYLKQIQDELNEDYPNYSNIYGTEEKSGLARDWGGKDNPWTGTHRPFGKLNFQFDNSGDTITGYRRSLDLQSALSSVNYTAMGTDFSREAFVSNPDQVLALKYSANQSGKVTFDVNFGTEDNNGGTGKTTAGDGYLEWNGAVFNYENKEYPITDGVKTFAYMKAINTGGQVTYDEDGLHVSGADDVVLIVSLGTDFTAGKDFVQNTKENCKAQLDAAVAKGYDALKTDHVNDVKPRFDRMKVEIGPADQLRAAEPVDVRLEKIRNGGEIDGSFMSLWYQYARYLMIAGSRENSPMPMNLQGIWNDNVAANMAWTCDYHLDINIQMNQWMSNSSNLSEGELPIFKWLENILIPNGQKTAMLQYGIGSDKSKFPANINNADGQPVDSAGWVSSIMTNAWGNTSNPLSVGGWHGNTTCGAWLVQEVMNYYQHTWDKTFLEKRGFPILKETANFYLNYMIQRKDSDGKTYWVTSPSSSPEHGELEVMSTMEITVISDIFQQVLNCYDYLNLTKDGYYNTVKEKLDNIAPYKVLANGSLAEWPYNKTGSSVANGDTNHRHTSHLLGLFPYAQITPDKTPELAQASLISMQKRFDRSDFEHTEWTAVNAQGMYARLKDAENAYKYLKLQGDTFTWPNLLSISPEGIALAPCDVYIIDGTFGVGQATAEMLLQSHSNRLEFLPALPREWKEGNIEGMSAEGAFDVSFAWDDYTLKSAQITSKVGNTCNIFKNAAINWQNVDVFQVGDGNTLTKVDTSKSTPSLLTFDTVANGVYVLKNKAQQEMQTGRLINDTDSRIQYSEGFQYNGPRENKGDYYNDAHYAQKENETAEFTFTGTGIDILAATDNAGSEFEVVIDGVSKGTATTLTDQPYAAQQAVYSVDDLAYGTHTIQIVKKAGQYLVLDGFAIRGQYFHYIDDNSPMITYGDGWKYAQNRKNDEEGDFHDYSGTLHYTEQKESSLVVNFSGTGIEVLSEKNQAYGDLEFELDGVNMGTVSITAPPNGKREGASNIWQVSNLANVAHQLKITNKGGGAWDWGWGAIDGFILLNEGGASLSGGYYRISGMEKGQNLYGEQGRLTLSDTLTGSANQKWLRKFVNDTDFMLINANSGLALSVAENNATSSQQPANPGDTKQLWQEVPATDGNGYVMLMNKEFGKYLQIDTGYEGNGGGVSLYPYEGYLKTHFNWKISDAGDGLVTLQNGVGTFMQIEGEALSAGPRAVGWERMAGNDQRWNITLVAKDQYTISQVGTGLQLVDQSGTTVLAPAESAANIWTAVTGKDNGVTYYAFTNTETGNPLTFGGETRWKLTERLASLNAAPYIYDISVNSPLVNDQTVSVSYKYGNDVGIAEKQSHYDVYVLDTLYDDLVNPAAQGDTTAAAGITFTLPGNYDASKTIVVKIVPTTEQGEGKAFFHVISPFDAPLNNMQSKAVVTEAFDESGQLATILAKEKGWTHEGYTKDDKGNIQMMDNYALSIDQKDARSSCLGFTTKGDHWWETSTVQFSPGQAFDEFQSLGDQVYAEINMKFEPTSNFDKDSKLALSLKNNSGKKFATVMLTGQNLDLLAMSGNDRYTKYYPIARDVNTIKKQWYNFKFYIDTANSVYAVAVNDELVRCDNGSMWFKPAELGSTVSDAAPMDQLGSLAAVELSHEWMSLGASVFVDDMKFGTFTIGDPDKTTVNYLTPENNELIYGQDNNVSISIIENDAVQDGTVMVGLYHGGDDVLVDSVRFENIAFDSRGQFDKTFQISVPKVGGDYTLKAFVWNAQQQPLGKICETKVAVSTAFTMPNVFSDNMMLQANKQSAIWGTALAGDEIQVELYDAAARQTVETLTATADENGSWETTLSARDYGGKYTLTVTCDQEKLTYQNIIFGDVYILAGQSNMEYWMSGLQDTRDDLEANRGRANNPNIRTVNLLNNKSGSDAAQENFPETDRPSTWLPMNFDEAWLASQIGYYFAQELNEDLDRPIGLISTAVGGTGIDRWKVGGDLFNHRIYPCRKLEISGVLFYQGEQDEFKSAEDYSDLMAGLIDGYRDLFGNPSLPFYYAQLARLGNQNFQTIRAAQVWAMGKVANPDNVAMISTLDEVGNKKAGASGNSRNDVHPYGKAEIARRFAARAKHDIYGMSDVIPAGPMYRSKQADGNKLVLTFDCTGSLKVMAPDAQGNYQYADDTTQNKINRGTLDPTVLHEFEIAGADGVYKKATAEISGNKVILSSPEVSNPVHARYAFSAYPEAPNLTDDSGMGSYTFSTEYANS